MASASFHNFAVRILHCFYYLFCVCRLWFSRWPINPAAMVYAKGPEVPQSKTLLPVQQSRILSCTGLPAPCFVLSRLMGGWTPQRPQHPQQLQRPKLSKA